MNRVLVSCASIICIAAVDAPFPPSMACGSRLSGGVRINPQKTGVIAGLATESCQSIHFCAPARPCRSPGSSLPGPCFAARYRTIVFDSHRMKPSSSSSVGCRVTKVDSALLAPPNSSLNPTAVGFADARRVSYKSRWADGGRVE